MYRFFDDPSASLLLKNGNYAGASTLNVKNHVPGTQWDVPSAAISGAGQVTDPDITVNIPAHPDTVSVGLVDAPPVITADPVSRTVTVGKTAVFSVTAAGNGLTYQWQKSTDSGGTWTNVTAGTGDTTDTYTTPAADKADSGSLYRCVVTRGGGSAISAAATLTVRNPLSPPTPSSYTVSFDTGGGSPVAVQTITEGRTLKRPADPTRDKYRFTGWYTDQACQNPYDFNKTVGSAFTLYAGWKWANPFTDVKDGSWYYEDVKYVHLSGLFEGTSESAFSPDKAMDRGMLVTVLGRLSGEDIPKEGFQLPFTDVDQNSYCAPYIAWAVKNGIVKGYDDKTFGPGKELTREQIAEILYRYAVYTGKGPQGEWAVELRYADAKEISSWAINGTMFSQKNNIVLGKPGNLFDPKAPATRAQVAAVLHRYSSNIK